MGVDVSWERRERDNKKKEPKCKEDANEAPCGCP